MNQRKAKRWLCLFVAVISFVIAFTFCIQDKVQEATNLELQVGAKMVPDWEPNMMSANSEQNFRQLQQMIDDTIEPDEWHSIGSSSTKPYRTIVSVLTNGEGCKTFVHDANGKLLPDVESHENSAELMDNPFGDSNR